MAEQLACFCSTTFPKQKLEQKPVFLRGEQKNEDIFQEVPEGFVSVSLPSLSRDWGGGGLSEKTMALSTASAAERWRPRGDGSLT